MTLSSDGSQEGLGIFDMIASGSWRSPESWRPPESFQQSVGSCVHSSIFQSMISFAIILNVIYLGLRINSDITNTLDALEKGEHVNTHHGHSWISLMFFALFSVEMLLRLFADRMTFFCGTGKLWNMFDMLCLASMALEHLPIDSRGLGNMSVFRLFRLLRIFRAARAVKLLQQFKQLRLMLYSVVSCLVSMFWACSLLLLVNSLFALYLEDAAVVFLVENSKKVATFSATEAAEFSSTREHLSQHWKGMPAAVLSLIYSISGGADWGTLAHPFWSVGIGYGLSYVFFVILTIFGLLNILVGIFVQEAEELSKWDKDFVVDVAEFVEKKKEKEKLILNLFDAMADSAGTISIETLEEQLTDENVAAQFQQLEVGVEKVDLLMHVIDVDGNGIITKEEFTEGVAKLTGKAHATDVAEILLEEQKQNAKIEALKETICERIDFLQESLGIQGGPASRSSGTERTRSSNH